MLVGEMAGVEEGGKKGGDNRGDVVALAQRDCAQRNVRVDGYGKEQQQVLIGTNGEAFPNV